MKNPFSMLFRARDKPQDSVSAAPLFYFGTSGAGKSVTAQTAIRYREDIKPGMWVRFQGDKWNISTLGEYSFKRTYLGLKASIAKGVSG